MENYCDLHVHSTCSDGTLSPAELVSLAAELGLGAVALCDHNTVAGLPEFLAAAADSGVEGVPGIEFSTEYRGGELHILALFVQPRDYPAVTDRVAQMLRRKEQSNLALVEKLNEAGLSLDYAAIQRNAGGTVNRAVIAAEMVRLGYCTSVKEAFSKWLSEERGLFHPPKRLDALDTIRFIKSIGAVAVLAHPFLNLDEAGLREFLRQAVPVGLDGMEALYPKFSGEQTRLARQIAEEFGILISGGSDFHGANKPDIQLGSGRGELRVPMSCLDALRRQSKKF
ncbi:MAG: PHP domain-containing protein [Oscillospiraceae bacterium]|nr:PHP domain-containing protein [Oscillospiraceae bacterium]